ncbi:facilitated trehalose transporter Tret1 isoform X1 [Megachile rotundata]|uniref:facilitated trehalose transporter Tret1 isoform X1 n=1 Tax=Megachile rotundata TaxID=143995 RepID=UPI003FD0ACE2
MTSASINVTEIRKLNQYLGAFVASLGGFALGVSLGWNSSAIVVFKNHLDASATEIGLIGGLLNAGACLGAILVPFLLGKIPPTTLMFSMIHVLAVGWILICIADHKAILFIIGRVICGISSGIFCVIVPIYIAEIACKEIRGRLLTIFHLLINCGVMYAFSMAHILEEHETVWRYSSICGIACLSIAPTKLLPETPLYHLSRNDESNAEKSLKWYRGDTYDVQHEISEMKRLVLAERSRKWSLKVIRNRRVLRSIASCIGVIVGQHVCGVNMMIFYALTLFETTGSGELTGSEQTLVVGVVQILATLLVTFLVDILGRRILLTLSTMLMGVFLILLGWFFSLREADPEYDDIYFWMPPAWIILFFAAFNLGLGPIAWTFLGDTLPIELRTPVTSFAVTLGWLISLMATLTFEEIFISVGGTKIMWLSAAGCWLVALFCAILVMDVTGKSLVEVQQRFATESQGETERNSEET